MVDPLGEVKSFLVPLDGTDASYNALAVACDIARRTHAEVSALHVIEVPRSQPLGATMAVETQQAEAILTRAEEIAGEHDVRVVCDLLQAREAGQALVDEAVDRRTDAIVVGLDYHRPHGRFELGRLPQYVLANAPCQVWLIRYPPEPADDGQGGVR